MIQLKSVLSRETAQKILNWSRSEEVIGVYQQKWSWTLEDILDNHKIKVFVVSFLDDEIGFAYILINRFLFVEIGVTLLLEYRKRGIGTTVHQKLIEKCAGKYNYVEALIVAENLAEKKILEKLKFALVDRFYVGNVLISKYRKLINSNILDTPLCNKILNNEQYY